MNEYLIPANSKKSQLYFGLFKGIDLMILGAGVVIEIPMLILLNGNSILILFLKFLPIFITIVLLIPIAYYHNVRVVIKEIYLYFKYKLEHNEGYYWRGWCASYDTDEESKN